MPRRNRNAGTPRPDTDQLAADLALLAADLDLLTACLAYATSRGYLLTVTGGNPAPPATHPRKQVRPPCRILPAATSATTPTWWRPTR